MTRSFEVTFEVPDGLWLSANGKRLHWTVVRRRVADLRYLAYLTARQMGLPQDFGRSHVGVLITPRSTGQYDPNNASPTTKPLIDGLTDWGIWPNDDHKWVEGPDHRRGDGIAPPGKRIVHLTVTEIEARP